MDLYLTNRTARNAVIWVLNSVGAILLLWLISLEANASQKGTDYLFPSQAKGGYLIQPSSAHSTLAASKKPTIVSYKSFQGITYQLVEHRGRYVNVLVPQSHDGGPFFTADHIEELVDRLDMLYALYVELVQREPAGSGPATIAFVPQTCGMGCGLIGARGFEVQSDPRNYEAIIRELDAGRLESLLLHEMAHNFDLYSRHLHYLPDHGHAWTDMFEFFAPYRYARVNSHGEAPDDLYNSPVSAVWKDYVIEKSANWQHCVRDGACEDMGMTANNLWAMVYYRVESLFGVQAILGSFEFMRTYAQTHTLPQTDEEKEGLRILSLAVGAGANISCLMDSLKWPVPDAARAEMDKLFGPGNELCGDRDNDGFSQINGDCDDRDRMKNIARTEITDNNTDDDCDDLIDEAHLVEAEAGSNVDNFVNTVQTRLPFEVEGSTADLDDRDIFSFSLSPSRRSRVTLCAHGGFRGWVVARQPNGKFLEAANFNQYRFGPGCSSTTFDYGDFTTGTVSVQPDDSLGDYSLTVTEADVLLPDHSSFVQVTARPTGGMNVEIEDKNGLLASLGTDELEIWISGVGTQLFKPFTGNQSIELSKQTVPDLQNGETYQVRVRPRAGGLPLAAFSAGHLFRYDAAPAGLPDVDHSYSGAWFDASHDGEGFILEVLQDNRALVYWFTYQADGAQRWMIGVGDVIGNRVVVDELSDTHGGRFGPAFNPADVMVKTVGALSLSFLDCSTALVNYSVDEIGDHQSTARLTNVFGHECGSETSRPDGDISGSWYDPAHDGEGFIVEQLNDSEALVFWFSYDKAGGQAWMFNTGVIEEGMIRIPGLQQAAGGQFGRSYDPDTVTFSEWGELTLELGCSGGSAGYTALAEGYSDGQQTLVPLTRLANSGCSD